MHVLLLPCSILLPLLPFASLLLPFVPCVNSTNSSKTAFIPKQTMNQHTTQSSWTNRLGGIVNHVKTSVENKLEAARAAKEARAQGKIWNAATNEWDFYYLDEELKELDTKLLETATTTSSTASSSSTSSSHNDPVVADRTYYDLLGVSTNSNGSEIKKAYYRAARSCHPDKNPNDPTAQAKFQALGHAYQILANENSRAQYDAHGTQGEQTSTSADNIDPMVFFNVMFGSSLIEPYVGELWIAGATTSGLAAAPDLASLQDLSDKERTAAVSEQLRALEHANELNQRRRVVVCAQNYRARTQAYVDASLNKNNASAKNQWQASVREEANKVAAGAYGSLYCKTIGYTLMVCAEEYLGFEDNIVKGHTARMKQTASALGSNMKLVGATIKAASAGHKAMRQAEELQATMGGGIDKSAVDEQAAAQLMTDAMDQTLPAILEFTWAVNRRDIQTTLRQVFSKLMNDNTLDKPQRRLRAEAMRVFGTEFFEAGKQATCASHFEADDIKARVAAATMFTMAKAQGQEVSEEDQEDMIRQAKEATKQANTTTTDHHGDD